jgi:glycosyltransferase involved in cell wall biosynthesis
MPAAKPSHLHVVLLLDSPDRFGYAGTDQVDPHVLACVVAELRACWPRRRVRVIRSVPGTHRAGRQVSPGADGVDVVSSPFFTDARRLKAVARSQGGVVIVLRPAALLLPRDVLRATVERARNAHLDVALVDGISPEVVYVTSTRALTVTHAAGALAAAVTIPQAIERLRGAGLSAREVPLAIARLLAEELGWAGRALADALTPATWKAWPDPSLLDLDSEERLHAALRAQHERDARQRAGLLHVRGPVRQPSPGRRRSVLVTVPSLYQSGANAAWEELLGALPSPDVAFVCGRGTALQRLLEHRGFLTWPTADGLTARSASDGAVFFEALDAVRPDVVHFDGAEGNTWAPVAFARGVKIVQHVRLNDVDRFQPAFTFADAIVAVAPHLQERIVARLGASARVEHIADGIDLQTRCHVSRPHLPDVRAALGEQALPSQVRCLCVGRVEPEKGTAQVLAIARSLAAIVPADLLVVGSCGHDAAYCDAFTADVLAAKPPLTAAWRSFTHPIGDLYTQADVVIVGSRNEALGMVGLEALAAGCLLVARRSAGYACIVDESKSEGLLFDGSDAASIVAARIVQALAERERFALNGRRKVETHFDARDTAERLVSLWRDLAARRPSPRAASPSLRPGG